MKVNKEMIGYEQITKWENLKELIFGDGQGVIYYTDFRPFIDRKMFQKFGLYILHGIDPSPIVKIKFKPHSVNCVNGNDFFLIILDLIQSAITGTSNHLLHAKIFALNHHIALNTIIGK